MLPQHLFQDDWSNFFVKQNRQTYKAFSKVFEMSNDHSQALREAISEVTFAGAMSVDHPMCEKLA